MFYANFILAKKGPLAKIWLAAHYEKKLSKNQIIETDIQSSVNDIISPKVPIALRTSGHLLLGVVKIYVKKAKFLYDDANESFIKLKHLSNAEIFDLNKNKLVADIDSITLPDISDSRRLFMKWNLQDGLLKEKFINFEDFFSRESMRSSQPDFSFNISKNQSREIMRGNESTTIDGSDRNMSEYKNDVLVVPKDKITMDPNVSNFKKNFDQVNLFESDIFMDGDGIVPGIDDIIKNVDDITIPVDSTMMNDERNDYLSKDVDIILRPLEFKKELNEMRKDKRLKILIDDDKVIKSESFKRSLNDTNDIVKKKICLRNELYEDIYQFKAIQCVHPKIYQKIIDPNLMCKSILEENANDKHLIDQDDENENTFVVNRTFDIVSENNSLNQQKDYSDIFAEKDAFLSDNSLLGDDIISKKSLKYLDIESSKHWSKTTIDVNSEMTTLFQKYSKIIFSSFTNDSTLKNHSKAAIFYSLLVLHKENKCRLNQPSLNEIYLLSPQ